MSILCEPNVAGSFGSEPALPPMRPRIMAFGASPTTAAFVSTSPRAVSFTSPASSARTSTSASPSSFMTPDKVAAYRTLSLHGYGVSETATPSPTHARPPRVTVGFKVQADALNPPSHPDDEGESVNIGAPGPATAAAAAAAAVPNPASPVALLAAVKLEDTLTLAPAPTAGAAVVAIPEVLEPAAPNACASPGPASSLSSQSVVCGGILLGRGTGSRVKKQLAWADEIGNSLSVHVFFDAEAAPSSRTTRARGRFPPLSTPAVGSVPFPALGSPGSPSASRCPTELENACTVLPHCTAEITARLAERNILLESVSAMTHSPLVMLNIRVRNISYEKRVIVRLTKDSWATHFDVDASFMPGCLDGGSDRFYATVSISPSEAEQGVQFALCYRAGGQEFWDNNNGRNYRLSQGTPHTNPYSLPLYASPRASRTSADTFYA
eukprot:m.22863 g.22863  ORF g.22863 m.22863 type:complete len:439 (-) comp8386_c0_seq1:358-1674(-)